MAGPMPKFRVLAEIDQASGNFVGRAASDETCVWLVDQREGADGVCANSWTLAGRDDLHLTVRGVYESFARAPMTGGKFGDKSVRLTEWIYEAAGQDGRKWLVAFSHDAAMVKTFCAGADGAIAPVSLSQDDLKTLELDQLVIYAEFPLQPELEHTSLVYNVWEFQHLLRGRYAML